jgi:ParB-like chromosome segregation protein Spo0J
MKFKEQFIKEYEGVEDKVEFLEKVQDFLNDISPLKSQPINRVRWVDIEEVQANDYNPNSVAKTEMKLLYTSISHDGYTQPVVTVYDQKKKKYVIIDGFHRYFTCKSYKDILERNHGKLPIVVIDKDINDRMASTIRHNRARGKHSISGMSNIVFEMLDNGWSDADILEELGMESEELIRLKHITGFSKLFADTEYKKAWELKKQLIIKKKYKDENPNEKII